MRQVYETCQRLPHQLNHECLLQTASGKASEDLLEGLVEAIINELIEARQIFKETPVPSASATLKREYRFLCPRLFLEEHVEYEVFDPESVPNKVNWNLLQQDLNAAVEADASKVCVVLRELESFGWTFRPDFACELVEIFDLQAGMIQSEQKCRKSALEKLLRRYSCFPSASKGAEGNLPRHPLKLLEKRSSYYLGCNVQVVQPASVQLADKLDKLEPGDVGMVKEITESEISVQFEKWSVKFPKAYIGVQPFLPSLPPKEDSKYIALSAVTKKQAKEEMHDLVVSCKVLPPQPKRHLNGTSLEDFQVGLKYLCDPCLKEIALNEAQQEIKKLVLQQMPWKDVFLEIRSNIDAVVHTSRIQGHERDKLALSSFSIDTVQLVWKATSETVKKLDRNLEAFGLQLDMTGKGIIHFFSLVYAWMLVGEGSKMRSWKPINDLCADKEKWKTYFVSSLCANPREKSEVLGQQMADAVYSQAVDPSGRQSFLKKLEDQIRRAEPDFTAAKLQAALDQKLLLNPDPTASAEVVKYVTDQVTAIQDEFEKRWQEVYEPARDEILSEYKGHIRSLVLTYKERVEMLTDLLEDKGCTDCLSEGLFSLPEPLGSDFFVLQNSSICNEAASCFFSDFMSGNVGPEKWARMISGQEVSCEDRLQDILRQEDWSPKDFNPNLTTEMACQIPMLFVFCKMLVKGLEHQLSCMSSMQWELTDCGMDKLYNAFKNTSTGCTETCRTCLSLISLVIMILVTSPCSHCL